MNQIINKMSVFVIAVAALAQASTWADGFDAKVVPWKDLASDFTLKDGNFKGKLADRKDWEGFPCKGFYDITGLVTGRMDKPKVDVVDENTIDIVADLVDVGLDMVGSYKSKYTACFAVNGNVPATVDKVRITARVTFDQEEEVNGVPKFKVKIVKSEIGKLRFSRYVPNWLADMISKRANSLLNRVWASRIGDWVSTKLTDFAKNRIPKKN